MNSSKAIGVMKALSGIGDSELPRMYFKNELLQLVIQRIPKDKLIQIHYNHELQKEMQALVALGLMHCGDIPKEVENG